MRIAIVVSRFNDAITERLLDAAQQTLSQVGIAAEAVEILRVPGAYEIAMAANPATESQRLTIVG